MDELPLGAHLTSPRRGFVHHGVYVGNGQVIQYSGFERLLRKRPIELVSLADFTRGRGFAVVSAASTHYTALLVLFALGRGSGKTAIGSFPITASISWSGAYAAKVAAAKSKPCNKDSAMSSFERSFRSACVPSQRGGPKSRDDYSP